MENTIEKTTATIYGLQSPSRYETQTLYLKQKYPNTELKINSNQFIGIEVEVENVRNWEHSDTWSSKEDGSLRNHGVEYVSIPIPSSIAPEALLELFTKLLPENHIFSKRTSIHIHLDVTDLTPTEIKYLSYVYVTFENSFYRLVDQERKRNIFCIPIQDTPILNYLDYKKPILFERLKWHKYCGYNLLPIVSQGTVEFRQLHGTNDITLICNWISLICYLKDYIKTVSKEEIYNTILSLNTSSQYWSYCEKVFKDKASLIFKHSLFNKEIEKGIIALKTSIFPNTFENQIYEKTKDPNSKLNLYFWEKQKRNHIENTNSMSQLLSSQSVLNSFATLASLDEDFPQPESEGEDF